MNPSTSEPENEAAHGRHLDSSKPEVVVPNPEFKPGGGKISEPASAQQQSDSQQGPQSTAASHNQHEELTSAQETQANTSTDQPQQSIEAEDDSGSNRDDDSSYGDEVVSFTASLSSSIMNFKYENGRRYHAQDDTQYFLPNDDIENDRLDLFHHLLTLRCDGQLFLAPIGSNPQRILDLGTGTGIWAIEIGDAYPSASVLGNDLSPVQPNLVPPNVSFEVDDIERPWEFSRPFDFIHCRYLAGSIVDWPRLVAQAFQFTKPGGWVEFQDFDMQFYSTDGTFVPGSPPNVWTDEVIAAIKVFGREPEPGPKLEQWVRDAGFENVNHRLIPIPVGMWPKDKRMKEIGACDLSMFLEGLEGISLRAFTNARGWSPEEVLAFLPSVRKALCNKRTHALHDL
ncbi:Secondary metabolism regulator LAE1 [Lachnellula hyalina]|uniref:Secondary metabolism regulator LAE1 n=1 Tax=Lachnellula hyalina TaxID=1316788 RepID=A0A8H8R547_9HELO|nr:Secondary metabolism regulator LAE1 [Lachnellula hyalina]TVY27816.1 Secondary metabolism regulator LAE1 [Lachnellula hyalina]